MRLHTRWRSHKGRNERRPGGGDVVGAADERVREPLDHGDVLEAWETAGLVGEGGEVAGTGVGRGVVAGAVEGVVVNAGGGGDGDLRGGGRGAVGGLRSDGRGGPTRWEAAEVELEDFRPGGGARPGEIEVQTYEAVRAGLRVEVVHVDPVASVPGVIQPREVTAAAGGGGRRSIPW